MIIKTLERSHWYASGVFNVDSEHILLSSNDSIIDFEQTNVCQASNQLILKLQQFHRQ